MSGPITLFVNASPKNDNAEAAFNAAKEMAAAEPGTLTYRLFRHEDGSMRFYEDYESSEALLAHVANATENGVFAGLMGAFEFNEVTVLGTPTPAAKEALDGLGSRYAEHVSGFSDLGRMQTAT